MKLNVKADALTGGILLGASILILTVISGLTNTPEAGEYTGYCGGIIARLMLIYPGYNISVIGAILGTIYGFINGLAGTAIAAALYNLFCGPAKAD